MHKCKQIKKQEPIKELQHHMIIQNKMEWTELHVSPYMDLETSESVPVRFGVLPPLMGVGVRFLLSVLSASPLDMCLFSGR